MVGNMAAHLTLQLDPENHSLYIYVHPIGKKDVTHTEQIAKGVLIDLGKRGKLMGVEVLGSKAVAELFQRVRKEPRLKPLEKLAAKKSLLARLIA